MDFGDDIDKMLEGQAGNYFGEQPSRRRRRSRSRERSRRGDRRSRMTPEEMARIRAERLDRERERDQRTVFAAQIHPKNEEREVFDFFSEAGKVVDIQLIRDTRTYKSKGLAYIEFEDRRSVPHALALSGQNLNGYPVLVQMTQSDRGYVPQNTAVAMGSQKPKVLHVKHLHKKLKEDDILPIFNAFGEIRSIEIVDGPSENEAYIEFRRGTEATTAMVQLNGLEIVGQQISVEQANEQASKRFIDRDPQNEETTGRFEDESGNGGVVMSAKDKQTLMNNLAKRAGLAMPSQPNPFPYKQEQTRSNPGPTGPPPGRCIKLKHMFDPKTEKDPDFDLEIREDVREEVSQYGKLLHIYVDKNSPEGQIYLKFQDVGASQKAHAGLHGRWFAQNRIHAEYMEEGDYAQQFPNV